MSVKRLQPQSVVGLVPQDPRDTLKAELLEPQSPCGASGHAPVERLQPGFTHCTGPLPRPVHLR